MNFSEKSECLVSVSAFVIFLESHLGLTLLKIYAIYANILCHVTYVSENLTLHFS